MTLPRYILAFVLGWSACALLMLAVTPAKCPNMPWLAFVSGAPLWGGLGAFFMAFVQACAEHKPARPARDVREHPADPKAVTKTMTPVMGYESIEPSTRNMRAPKKTGDDT